MFIMITFLHLMTYGILVWGNACHSEYKSSLSYIREWLVPLAKLHNLDHLYSFMA